MGITLIGHSQRPWAVSGEAGFEIVTGEKSVLDQACQLPHRQTRIHEEQSLFETIVKAQKGEATPVPA